MTQNAVARACAAWLRDKADIRSLVKPNFLYGKLYHIRQESGIEKAIADVRPQEAEIDRLVYQLYNLTPEEIAIIEAGV